MTEILVRQIAESMISQLETLHAHCANLYAIAEKRVDRVAPDGSGDWALDRYHDYLSDAKGIIEYCKGMVKFEPYPTHGQYQPPTDWPTTPTILVSGDGSSQLMHQRASTFAHYLSGTSDDQKEKFEERALGFCVPLRGHSPDPEAEVECGKIKTILPQICERRDNLLFLHRDGNERFVDGVVEMSIDSVQLMAEAVRHL
ncbi:MAG: hypothetical protein F4W95_07975 [Chloroflexi bacterium]|nr:hypothetical protein [Chloroflexota bacterium]MYD48409.1 hypothetical protein [Chloroflexota bacterium]